MTNTSTATGKDETATELLAHRAQGDGYSTLNWKSGTSVFSAQLRANDEGEYRLEALHAFIPLGEGEQKRACGTSARPRFESCTNQAIVHSELRAVGNAPDVLTLAMVSLSAAESGRGAAKAVALDQHEALARTLRANTSASPSDKAHAGLFSLAPRLLTINSGLQDVAKLLKRSEGVSLVLGDEGSWTLACDKGLLSARWEPMATLPPRQLEDDEGSALEALTLYMREGGRPDALVWVVAGEASEEAEHFASMIALRAHEDRNTEVLLTLLALIRRRWEQSDNKRRFSHAMTTLAAGLQRNALMHEAGRCCGLIAVQRSSAATAETAATPETTATLRAQAPGDNNPTPEATPDATDLRHEQQTPIAHDVRSAPRSTALHTLLVQAHDAWQDEDDARAWSLLLRAQRDEPRPETLSFDEAGMILRLVQQEGTDEERLAVLNWACSAIGDREQRARAACVLARLFVEAGRSGEARRVLEQALARAPGTPPLRLELARVATVERAPDAQRQWQALLRYEDLEPWERTEYRREYAEAMLALGHEVRAIELLKEVHTDEPANAVFTDYLTRLMLEQGDVDGAVALRCRHAAAVGGLDGYPSVAHLADYAAGHRFQSTDSARATAQALALAIRITNPATWLRRALIALAEDFNDRVILELGLVAARDMDAFEYTREFARRLAELVSGDEDRERYLSLANDASQRIERLHIDTAPWAPPSTSTDTVGEEDIREAASVEEEGAQTVVVAPRLRLEELDAELQETRTLSGRADLLHERASLLLSMERFEEASQTWTGALILAPEDPRFLAGLFRARAGVGDARGANAAMSQLRMTLSAMASDERRSLPADVLATLSEAEPLHTDGDE